MRKVSAKDDKQQALFAGLPASLSKPKPYGLDHPVWTENKAHFIAEYLRLFQQVTKHGTYIDGFAGPQKPKEPGMWAAKLVLELKPAWLRHFYLFEENPASYKQLLELQKAHHQSRNIRVFKGDFNKRVSEILISDTIRAKEATFCLLDQRTFECHWDTLIALARYKTAGPKIELFYFLAYAWLHRAIAGQKKLTVLDRWWGGPAWRQWLESPPAERNDSFIERFKRELGYRHVFAWPVYRRKFGSKIMYHMIHASDHDEAPVLMSRAYNKTVTPPITQKQFTLKIAPDNPADH